MVLMLPEYHVIAALIPLVLLEPSAEASGPRFDWRVTTHNLRVYTSHFLAPQRVVIDRQELFFHRHI